MEDHNQTESERQFAMQLTEKEALFLDDSFTMMIQLNVEDQRPSSLRPIRKSAALAVPMDLLDQIGRAVLYTTDPINLGEDYEVSLTLIDLFAIREVSSSSSRIGKEPVGLNLKRKVCALLYTEDLAKEIRDGQVSELLDSLDSNVPVSAVDAQDI